MKKGLKKFDGNCSICAYLSLVPKAIGILIIQWIDKICEVI